MAPCGGINCPLTPRQENLCHLRSPAVNKPLHRGSPCDACEGLISFVVLSPPEHTLLMEGRKLIAIVWWLLAVVERYTCISYQDKSLFPSCLNLPFVPGPHHFNHSTRQYCCRYIWGCVALCLQHSQTCAKEKSRWTCRLLWLSIVYIVTHNTSGGTPRLKRLRQPEGSQKWQSHKLKG